MHAVGAAPDRKIPCLKAIAVSATVARAAPAMATVNALDK
jgi:hypothetical protein